MSHVCRRLCLGLPKIAQHGVPRALSQPSRCSPVIRRAFWASPAFRDDDANTKAKKLSQKSVDEQEQEVTARKKQQERPWHRAGSDAEPPDASTDPTKGDRTKGRLLTTPTRLLKVILPLPYHSTDAGKSQAEGENVDNAQEDIEPLALLVHPQQPLSYLERLIQAELPPIQDKNMVRVPNIYFRAEADHSDNHKNEHATKPKEGNVASYSGLGHEGPKTDDANWVRWSSSTDLGDFIRDAARGREFAIVIEGYEKELRVAVPSFNDRTYYMRMRLRRLSRRIDRLASIKDDCDKLAHRGAHRIAMSGFGVMLGWWGIVYYVSFHTDFGWDLVEPVTYLVGLTTIMGGYLWFLYISRDLSYKAALNVTVSKRQNALYQSRGFDIQKWESTVQEANALRREIKMVASEYDVDWDEMGDLGGEEVKKVLNKERKNRKKNEDDDEDDHRDEKKDDKDKKGAKEENKDKKKDD